MAQNTARIVIKILSGIQGLKRHKKYSAYEKGNKQFADSLNDKFLYRAFFQPIPCTYACQDKKQRHKPGINQHNQSADQPALFNPDIKPGTEIIPDHKGMYRKQQQYGQIPEIVNVMFSRWIFHKFRI